MRAAITVAAVFGLLSACANHGGCIQGAKDTVKGSGEAAFLALPFAYLGAAICSGITAASHDKEATTDPSATPPAASVAARGNAR